MARRPQTRKADLLHLTPCRFWPASKKGRKCGNLTANRSGLCTTCIKERERLLPSFMLKKR